MQSSGSAITGLVIGLLAIVGVFAILVMVANAIGAC